MEIPVHAEGVPRGVKNGGVLRFNLRRMKVKGLASKLPDYIIADVSPLKIGNKLYVTAVENEDYTILHPDNTVICQVKTSRNIVADADDEDDVDAGDVPATEVKDEGAAAASNDA
jgi:large subunit ribosomal protein L25